MRPIGGELELKYNDMHIQMTDSGRSSLRLILESGLKDKRFLVPDYLCEIILTILDEYKVQYSFYSVGTNMTADVKKIKENDFDVLYVINYFGQKNPLLNEFDQDNVYVIEDDVFSAVVERTTDHAKWIGFNSFRKVTPLADGSIMYSTMPFHSSSIHQTQAGFCDLKYEAKRIKYEFIHDHKHSEDEYLKVFKEAENHLDDQREIHTISKRSSENLLDVYLHLKEENEKRKANAAILDVHLAEYKVPLSPKYYSFYVFRCQRRDELRKFLFSKRIFLPVHWPKIKGIENPLYDEVLSIPLDSRYSEEDFNRIGQLISEFLGAKRQAVVQ